jgi:hypothetical protein
MYTYMEIFAWEVYFIGTTPGVFQCVRRFLLWSPDFGDVLWRYLSWSILCVWRFLLRSLDFGDVLRRSHSRSVPVCLEMFTPGSGCWRSTSEEPLQECSSLSVFWRCTLEELLQEHSVCPEIYTLESGFRRCTSEVSLQEHSVCPEIFTPECGCWRSTSEESLQGCFSVYAIVGCEGGV